ncbi:MAG: hypothetical protein IJV70_01285 [Clostridia bacterium]|nr:hypothetical protein [Clostridia bacterium]
MYTNLQNLMRIKGISTSDVAEIIGTTSKTVLSKTRRENDQDYKVYEAKKIALLFPEYKFDYVFKDDRDTEDGVAMAAGEKEMVE